MRKLALSVFLFLGSVTITNAQYAFDIPLMTEVWELIGEKYYVRDKKQQFVTVFPMSLQKLDNKTVELPGYVIPVNPGKLHSKFMFSVVPIWQCDFCGQDGIPDMVEVHLKAGAQPLPFDNRPIKLKGILQLNKSNNPYQPPVYLKEAMQVKF